MARLRVYYDDVAGNATTIEIDARDPINASNLIRCKYLDKGMTVRITKVKHIKEHNEHKNNIDGSGKEG